MSFGRARWRTEIERQETAGLEDDDAVDELEKPDDDDPDWHKDDPPDYSPRDLDSWLTRTPAHPSDFDEEC